jgi:UDP-N-acetyl-D-glucosamine dehydrogenase
MNLQNALTDRRARIGVIGLGYVGLPLAMEFARKGFRVTGLDISKERLSALAKGRSYVNDVAGSEIKRWAKAGRFKAADDFNRLPEQDVLIVCVQTPLRKTKEPDISNILAAVGEISKRLRKGQLVLLESTTYPGTTEEMVLPLLKESRLKLGTDFFLAFSPERVDPGNSRFTIANTPKVVGGADVESTRLAVAVYSQIIDTVVPVSSTRAAEVVKLLENTFRAVNIALVNEMAQVCHHLGLDVWEIIAAAATKPFGFMPFYPGPGIGGHCIPKDPQLLTWKMKTLNFEARFVQLASAVNSMMPEYTVTRIAELLNKDKKALNGSRVLVLGASYKPGSSDCRESPSVDVMDILLRAQAQVSYHDPFIPSLEVAGRRLSSVPLTPKALKAADCVVILTAHRQVDYRQVVRSARRVFDARNATAGLSSPGLSRL